MPNHTSETATAHVHKPGNKMRPGILTGTPDKRGGANIRGRPTTTFPDKGGISSIRARFYTHNGFTPPEETYSDRHPPRNFTQVTPTQNCASEPPFDQRPCLLRGNALTVGAKLQAQKENTPKRRPRHLQKGRKRGGAHFNQRGPARTT